MSLGLPHRFCLRLNAASMQPQSEIWKLQKLNKEKGFHQFHIQAQDHTHTQKKIAINGCAIANQLKMVHFVPPVLEMHM